ncbi:hypothetical protein ACFLYA_01490 [Candidatus Dependentiae bacterium]
MNKKSFLLAALLAVTFFCFFKTFGMEQTLKKSEITRFQELEEQFNQKRDFLTIEELKDMKKELDNLSRMKKDLEYFDQVSGLLKGLSNRISEIEKIHEKPVSKPKTAFDHKVEELLQKRDTAKGARRFSVTLPDGRPVENVVVQLPAINQFHKTKYLPEIRKIVSVKRDIKHTCPGMSIRSARWLTDFFANKLKDRDVVEILKSYDDAILSVKFFEKKKKRRITNLPAIELLDILKKSYKSFRSLKLKDNVTDNVTVIESVGVFDTLDQQIENLKAFKLDWRKEKPYFVYAKDWLDTIKNKIQTAKDGFNHAFILGTLDKAYYDRQLKYSHWFAVFVAKSRGKYYWFVVDTAGEDNLDTSSIEFARIRYLIESLFGARARDKINYGNILKTIEQQPTKSHLWTGIIRRGVR